MCHCGTKVVVVVRAVTEPSRISSTRVNRLNTNTRWFSALSLWRSLSRTLSLPECSISSSPPAYGGGSAPSNKNGWLQHLRSCMTSDRSRRQSSLEVEGSPSTTAESSSTAASIDDRPRSEINDWCRCKKRLYQKRCISDMGTRN